MFIQDAQTEASIKAFEITITFPQDQAKTLEEG